MSQTEGVPHVSFFPFFPEVFGLGGITWKFGVYYKLFSRPQRSICKFCDVTQISDVCGIASTLVGLKSNPCTL